MRICNFSSPFKRGREGEGEREREGRKSDSDSDSERESAQILAYGGDGFDSGAIYVTGDMYSLRVNTHTLINIPCNIGPYRLWDRPIIEGDKAMGNIRRPT